MFQLVDDKYNISLKDVKILIDFMNKIFLLLIVLLLFVSCNLVSQNNYWQPLSGDVSHSLRKQDHNLKFSVDSTISLSERNDIVARTKRYINQNLELLNESSFNDSIHIIILSDRGQMEKYIGFKYTGIAMPKEGGTPENMIYCVYAPIHSPLRHELMHVISFVKWGYPEDDIQLAWLIEGLATYADPEAENCDGHTFEERYVYFLQNEMLLDLNIPIRFEELSEVAVYKTAYSQSAYIVGALIDEYGIEKIKELWKSGMDNFSKIFGVEFDDKISMINEQLRVKYPKPIEFNSVGFNKRCIE